MNIDCIRNSIERVYDRHFCYVTVLFYYSPRHVTNDAGLIVGGNVTLIINDPTFVASATGLDNGSRYNPNVVCSFFVLIDPPLIGINDDVFIVKRHREHAALIHVFSVLHLPLPPIRVHSPSSVGNCPS